MRDPEPEWIRKMKGRCPVFAGYLFLIGPGGAGEMEKGPGYVNMTIRYIRYIME